MAFGWYLPLLSAASRLTRRVDFVTALRRGRRAACGSVVVHLRLGGTVDAVGSPSLAGSAQGPTGDFAECPRVGFVVSRAVGGAVVRHRVQRRLRHLMRCRLTTLPAGALVVVRALPASAGASSAALGDDLDGALRKLLSLPPANASSLGRRR